MGMMINRRRVFGGKSLPYDAEIEYLESSGKQYINTRIAPTVDTDCELEFQLTVLPSSTSYICGTQNWPANAYNFMNANAAMQIFRYCYNDRNTLSTNVPLDLLKHTSKFDTQNKLYIFDDATFPLYTNYTYTKNYDVIYLFALNNMAVQIVDFYCQMRIFSFILSRQGVNILDLIPVRVGQVGYMYDKVSGQLFGNAGTGNFILGPDV